MKFRLTKLFVVFSLLFFHTNLANANWKVVKTVSTRLIWHIAYADNNTIYAVGDSLLMKSSDGGNTWIDLLPNIAPVTADMKFFNLEFINKDTGFVFKSTQTANVFRTTDGGITWIDVSQSINLPFILDMEFVTQNVAYAVGGFFNDSVIAKTNDGGLTWSHVTRPSLCDYPMAVSFITDSIGFTGDAEIYKTIDAGTTWTLTTNNNGWPTSASYGDRVSNYYFLDNQRGFALRDNWHIYKTLNGGNTWDLKQLPVTGLSVGCRDIVFDQSTFGYIVGYELDQPFVSKDAGETWLLDGSYPAYAPATCISISKDHKVVIGTSCGDVVLEENYLLANPVIESTNYTTIYPNPSNGLFTITTKQTIQAIEVYNLHGALVLRKLPQDNAHMQEIDLTNLPKGLYYVKISDGNDWFQGKVVIE